MKIITTPLNYDESFKGMISASTIDVINLCYPKIAETIDFTKPIEFLEQELIKENQAKIINC